MGEAISHLEESEWDLLVRNYIFLSVIGQSFREKVFDRVNNMNYVFVNVFSRMPLIV